jgi:signal transduction histidine kinase
MASVINSRLEEKMRSLWIKLISAFAGIILIGVVVNSLLINQVTQSQFSQYVSETGLAWATRLAPSLASFYAQNGSWQGVDSYLGSSSNMGNNTGGTNPQLNRAGSGMMNNGMMSNNGMWDGGMQDWMGSGSMGDMWGMMDFRLILADNQGKVVADTAQTDLNRQLSTADLQTGIPLQVNSQPVGTLLAISTIPVKQSIGSDFLSAVTRSTWITGLITGVLGLILGFFLFRQIVSPIQAVTGAASKIAAGQLNQRVPVKSNDEIGTMARTFNRMADSLERDQKLRQNMIADIAHELNTPLTVLQANLEAMVDGVLPMNVTEVTSLRDETALLARLVADLRLLSLAEAGQLKLEKTTISVPDLIQRAVEPLKTQAEERQIIINVNASEDLPLVSVDPDRMSMVLRNLVNNALRYTPPNGQIDIHAEKNKGTMTIQVADSGTGIQANDIPFIFDRFYRADKSRSRNSGGSGIGLAIVKQLVEAHHGEVKVDSPIYATAEGAGYGTRFTIQIPITS